MRLQVDLSTEVSIDARLDALFELISGLIAVICSVENSNGIFDRVRTLRQGVEQNLLAIDVKIFGECFGQIEQPRSSRELCALREGDSVGIEELG